MAIHTHDVFVFDTSERITTSVCVTVAEEDRICLSLAIDGGHPFVQVFATRSVIADALVAALTQAINTPAHATA